MAIFLSGTGSNFEAIAQACENHELDAQISVVFSNNPSALGVIKAQHRNIPTVVIPHYKPRQQFDLDVIAALENYRIDWVILCGYMRILSPAFLAHFQDKVINIHPSLLPHYPGVDAVARAFAAGEKRVGVTVH
ncbi:MAG: phosphoribosylglycinamide formyltransferase, partial [Deltaproteobacteria bacterium]|nr:phosphoribosylglycinamide formyltransferase [Deltaproteobacteria bacterium]